MVKRFEIRVAMIDSRLIERLRTATTVFANRRILAAYAFGSRVSGTARAGSDLDVGYYLDGYRAGACLDVLTEMQLMADLSRVTGVEVDLRNLGHAPLDLKGRVLEQGVRVYSGDPPARVALERDLLARYHDYKREFQLMHERRLRTVAEHGLR